MRYPQSILDEIKARVPVSAVVAKRVTWDKRKTQAKRGDYWGCCPFHSERTPSFHADDRRGHYKCFGCGVGGDVFTFIAETEGVDFPEAVERLAREAGVELPKASADVVAAERRRLGLLEILERAAGFFQERLRSPSHRDALTYAQGRGLTDDLLERFRIGFAPDARTDMKSALMKAGAAVEDLAEVGLLVAGDNIPVPYDRFRGRLMWPVLDERGRVIAFSGRDLTGKAHAKYLNSPDTPIYKKGAVVFNWKAAREATRAGHTPVLLEGQMDVTAAVGGGFLGAVAPMGTAVTEEQLMALWRLDANPVACFDGDEAGRRAASRLLDLALPHLAPARTIRFATIEPGQDPDGLIKAQGPKAFRRVLMAAMPLVDALWRWSTAGRTLGTPEERAALEVDLMAKVEAIKDQAVRKGYRDDLRDRLYQMGKRSGRVVRSNGQSLKSASPAAFRLAHGFDASGALSLKEASLLSAMVRAPSAVLDHAEGLAAIDRLSPLAHDGLTAILSAVADLPVPDEKALRACLELTEVRGTIDQAMAMCANAGLSLGEADASAILRELAGTSSYGGRN